MIAFLWLAVSLIFITIIVIYTYCKDSSIDTEKILNTKYNLNIYCLENNIRTCLAKSLSYSEVEEQFKTWDEITRAIIGYDYKIKESHYLYKCYSLKSNRRVKITLMVEKNIKKDTKLL